jgi:hypothetical protein
MALFQFAPRFKISASLAELSTLALILFHSVPNPIPFNHLNYVVVLVIFFRVIINVVIAGIILSPPN